MGAVRPAGHVLRWPTVRAVSVFARTRCARTPVASLVKSAPRGSAVLLIASGRTAGATDAAVHAEHVRGPMTPVRTEFACASRLAWGRSVALTGVRGAVAPVRAWLSARQVNASAPSKPAERAAAPSEMFVSGASAVPPNARGRSVATKRAAASAGVVLGPSINASPGSVCASRAVSGRSVAATGALDRVGPVATSRPAPTGCAPANTSPVDLPAAGRERSAMPQAAVCRPVPGRSAALMAAADPVVPAPGHSTPARTAAVSAYPLVSGRSVGLMAVAAAVEPVAGTRNAPGPASVSASRSVRARSADRMAAGEPVAAAKEGWLVRMGSVYSCSGPMLRLVCPGRTPPHTAQRPRVRHPVTVLP